MPVVLDIIGAMLIGGMMILIIMNANMITRDAMAYYTSEEIVHNMIYTNAIILENDIRNMGSGLDIAQSSIIDAREQSLTFRTCLRPDDVTPVTIRYYLGDVTELDNTDNPNDRYLYRQIDLNPPQIIGIVTYLEFKYYDTNNSIMPFPITSPSNIRMIEITMNVQNPYQLVSYDTDDEGNIVNTGKYGFGVWRQTRLSSPNFMR